MYPIINDMWHKLESGQGVHIDYEVQKILSYINQFEKLIDRIEIADLATSIPPEKLENVKHNKMLFREGAYLMKKHAKGIKYADDLKITVPTYIRKLDLRRSDYQSIASTEKELSKKIIAALTHPDNVEDLELKIKRMSDGTMSQKEFQSIFLKISSNVIRKKTNDSLKDDSFSSLKKYKSSLENPQKEESMDSWLNYLERFNISKDFYDKAQQNKQPKGYGFRIKK